MQIDIASRAMLVSLTITGWSCHKQDKEATETVHREYQARGDGGKFNKRLLAKDALREIKRIAGEARNTHYQLTVPWAQDGARMLMTTMHPRYNKEMVRLRDLFEQAVRDFLQAYPEFVNEARARLGGLFKAGDYPDVSELRERFTWDLVYLPIPTGSDVRLSLSDTVLQQIKQDVERRTMATVEAAAKDVWHRAHKVVQHLASSLTEYAVVQDEGKTKVLNPFRDSTVENVVEMAELLPALNIANDPELDRIAHEIKAKLTKHAAQELRDSKQARASTAKAARNILSDMADFMKG